LKKFQASANPLKKASIFFEKTCFRVPDCPAIVVFRDSKIRNKIQRMLQKPAFDRLKKGKKMEPNDTKNKKENPGTTCTTH